MTLQAITTFNFKLRLPEEHGVIVVFALASGLALFFPGNFTENALTQICLWFMLLSIHDKRQLLTLTIIAALTTSMVNSAAAVWLVTVCGGMLFTRALKPSRTRIWRELIGTAGAAFTPLIAALTVSGCLNFFIQSSSIFFAAVAFSTGLIHLSVWRKSGRFLDLKIALLGTTLAVSILLCVSGNQPKIAALTLLPFVGQTVWLAQRKPGFKQLGMVEAGCLFWTAILIVMQNFSLL